MNVFGAVEVSVSTSTDWSIILLLILLFLMHLIPVSYTHLIRHPKLERILIFTIEHLHEMGDLCRKDLVMEVMGKHSNLIFCTEDGTIIDSIKHISAQVSSCLLYTSRCV